MLKIDTLSEKSKQTQSIKKERTKIDFYCGFFIVDCTSVVV